MVISFQKQGSQPPDRVCYHAGEGNDRGEYVRVRFTIQKPFPVMDRVSIIENKN